MFAKVIVRLRKLITGVNDEKCSVNWDEDHKEQSTMSPRFR